MTHSHGNLLGEPPATLLPPNPEADAELAEGTPAAEVASRHPTVSAAAASIDSRIAWLVYRSSPSAIAAALT